MQLPENVEYRLNQIIDELKPSNLKNVQKNLTDKYKNQSGTGKSLISSSDDSLLYAISRMPATFVVDYSLISLLMAQNLIKDISSVFDVGSGTGAGYFAVTNLDKNIDISLFERDKNMVYIFDKFETGKKVINFDVTSDNFETNADLVMTSYMLSELADNDRLAAAEKLFNAAEKYLLIIDTGTPKVWQQMMEIKTHLESLGGKTLAPCMSEKCPLENDYCQFYARVERSSLHRIIKDGSLPFEDEKYFYLLVSKTNENKPSLSRIIRRPQIKPNIVTLTLCDNNGVSKKDFSKRNKETFKKAKKSKINELI